MATDEKNELSFDRMKSSFLGKITSAKEKISSKIDNVLRDESSSNSSSSTTATSEAYVPSSSSSMSFPSFEFGSSSSSHLLPLPVNTSVESISERKIKYKTLFAELNQNVLLKSFVNELSDSFHEIQMSQENSKDTSSFVAKLDDAFSLLASSLPTVTSKSSLTISRYSVQQQYNIK